MTKSAPKTQSFPAVKPQSTAGMGGHTAPVVKPSSRASMGGHTAPVKR